MKKLITATALAAFAVASTAALAEDSKMNTPLQKTPTQQQMETNSTSGAKVKTPAATTGASSNMNATVKPGESTMPGHPDTSTKNTQGK